MNTALILTIFIVSAIIWLSFCAFKIIKPGEFGLVVRQGATTNRVLESGWHYLKPLIASVVRYPARELTYMVVETELIDQVQAYYPDIWVGHPLHVTTADNATASILYTIRFRLFKEAIPSIHDRFGKTAIRGLIRDESRHVIRLTLNENNYTASGLLGPSRAKVESDINERLRQKLATIGMDLTHFGLREPDLGELGQKLKEEMHTHLTLQLQQAHAKIEAENNHQAEIKAESEARIHAEKVKAEASAMAEAKKIQTVADAECERIKRLKKVEAELEVAQLMVQIEQLKAETEAYQLLKKAEVEAKANKLLANSMTDTLATWMQSKATIEVIKQWDGKLPLFTGEKLFPFINFTEILTQSLTKTDHAHTKNK